MSDGKGWRQRARPIPCGRSKPRCGASRRRSRSSRRSAARCPRAAISTRCSTLIMAKVTELMEADRVDAVPASPRTAASCGRRSSQGGERVEIRLEVGEGIAGWVAQTREIVNIPDAYADQRFQPAVDLKSGYRTRSILCVPMLGALGGLVGVLQVLNKQDGPFTHARRGAADRAREPGRDRDRERAALSLAGRAEPGAVARAPRPRAPDPRAQRALRGREGAVGGARSRRPAVAHPRAGDHRARRRRRLDRAGRARRLAAVLAPCRARRRRG